MTETLVGASMRLRFSVSGYWPSMWAVPRLERSASARRRCRCSSIRCVHVDALPIPHRTDTSPKCVFGASVRVLPRGVQRRAALAGIEQDLFGMPASTRRATAKDPELDLPGMPCRSRPRPQRRQEDSRRRTGGETKRPPCKWAGSRRRFWWSPGKPSLPSRGPGR